MKTKSFKKYLESRLTKEEIEEIEKVSDSFSFIIQEKDEITESSGGEMHYKGNDSYDHQENLNNRRR